MAVAVAGEIPLAGPLVAVAVTGLLPIVSAAVERRRETRSQRAMRARAYADSAWDAIMASREGCKCGHAVGIASGSQARKIVEDNA